MRAPSGEYAFLCDWDLVRCLGEIERDKGVREYLEATADEPSLSTRCARNSVLPPMGDMAPVLRSHADRLPVTASTRGSLSRAG